MSPSNTTPILVAGGGPSGLIAALTLLQNNVPVRIIDKEAHYRIGERANSIWPRTFEVFHLLHAQDIHQKTTPFQPVYEYEAGAFKPTKTFWMTRENDPTPSTPYNSARLIGQPALEALLRSYLEKYGVQVELSTELKSFVDDGERVLANLVKKKDGEEICETFEASYIVGADGAKGVTRKQLGLSFLGETTKELVSVIGDICIDAEEIDREHWHIFGDKSANLLVLRPADDVGPDGFQFMFSRKDYEPKQLIADERLMIKTMSDMTGREIKLRKVVFLSEYRPNIRMVDKFGIGRVFVAGDAAHVHSPTGGQGLNTSVQDALNLAWKLALVYKGLSPSTLLDSYTTERLPVVAEMLNITTGYLKQLTGTPSIEGAMKREKRMDMLGVNCRTSPIVLDEYTKAEPVSAYGVLEEGVLVAGDRAPDAPGLIAASESGTGTSTKARLFDVFSPTYHTVLVFTADVVSSAHIVDVLSRYPRDIVRSLTILPQGVSGGVMSTATEAEVVVDRDGHAYGAYLASVGETKVVVVRPDGVVGAMVHGVEGLGTYFSKVLL